MARPENSFEIASNPEFLREGSGVTDFLFPDRIVVGANSERGARLLREIYQPLTDGSYARRKDAIPEPDQARIPTRLIETSARSAELIKQASNAFLAMKISFINAVANICEGVDADIEQVCAGMGSDARIGDRFLSPGIGYGGSCFPKDLKAFRTVARESGYDFRLLDEVIRINEEQCRRFLRKVRNALWTLKGKRLAVLGLAFKGGTDDVRESPAIAMIELLLREGCEVAAYDPAAMPKCRELLQERVTFAESVYEAAENADALLLLSDWEEFAALDLQRLRRIAEISHRCRRAQSLRSGDDGGAGIHVLQRWAPGCVPQEKSEARSATQKGELGALLCACCFLCGSLRFPRTLGPIRGRFSAILHAIVVVLFTYRAEGFVIKAGGAESFFQFFGELMKRLEVIGRSRDLSLRRLQELLVSLINELGDLAADQEPGISEDLHAAVGRRFDRRGTIVLLYKHAVLYARRFQDVEAVIFQPGYGVFISAGCDLLSHLSVNLLGKISTKPYHDGPTAGYLGNCRQCGPLGNLNSVVPIRTVKCCRI